MSQMERETEFLRRYELAFQRFGVTTTVMYEKGMREMLREYVAEALTEAEQKLERALQENAVAEREFQTVLTEHFACNVPDCDQCNRKWRGGEIDRLGAALKEAEQRATQAEADRAWFSSGEWTYNGAPVSVEDMNAVVERALKAAERELEFCRQHHCAGVRVFCKPEPAAGASQAMTPPAMHDPGCVGRHTFAGVCVTADDAREAP